jgi:hypothetical protein
MRQAPLAVALIALALCPAAAAHGGGGARGFTSTVTAIEPATPGIELRVLDGDDRIGLRNETGKTILVSGYDGEPYLRFTADAVYRNERSPATYLNEERYGDVELPARADAKAAPEWKQVADSAYYEWHDHRIHWMSPVPPPQVRAAEGKPHHVFDWKLPIRIGGRTGRPRRQPRLRATAQEPLQSAVDRPPGSTCSRRSRGLVDAPTASKSMTTPESARHATASVLCRAEHGRVPASARGRRGRPAALRVRAGARAAPLAPS